jgi:hypothetical protein
VLRKAIEKADADVAKAKQDADEKKWRIVADQMKVLKVCIHFADTSLFMTNSTSSSQSSTSPRTLAATASRLSKLARPSHLPNQYLTPTRKPAHASNHAVIRSRRFEKTRIRLLRTQTTSRAMLGLLACVPTIELDGRSCIENAQVMIWTEGTVATIHQAE